jgi:zinc protease
MSRLLLFALAGLALGGCKKSADPVPVAQSASAALPEGVTLVETVEKTDDRLVIPYRKFRLANGLTVILHEDDSDPIVHVDVTYHVGSGREEVGRSGFAHFFEHMMFQGSEHVADEEHFKIITASGGTLNGTTNSDRTNYFETVPSNQLEKMLWLESDRMGWFLDAVTQEKFEVQRETVKNERGQRVDNRPYGRVYERLGEAIFPEGHPYSWTTIGYIEDLNRADLDDLKRFFLRWYGPNNATLTIGGRFDEAETLAWVAQYFGPIPAGPEVADPVYEPVTLDADRYLSMEDEVELPLLNMEWPTVHARHPDEAPLDVLMSILGDGKTSLLYKNLVKPGIAVQASAGHGCRELSCEFSLYALVNPDSGKSLADVEAILRGSLEEFETRGVLDDDLERVKQGIVAGLVFGLESVSGKVSSLAAYETFTGDPDTIAKDVERYSTVTAADVVRVYEQYVKGKPAVVMSVLRPDGVDQPAKPDTFTRPERDIPDREPGGELEMRRAVSPFDRSVQPPSGPNPTLTVPTLWRGQLANSTPVMGTVNAETPTTAIRIRIEAGQKHEPAEKAGLAALTAAMVDESTTASTNEELANRLDKLGASIAISADDNTTSLTIRALTETLDEVMAIANEKLRMPAFQEDDFARVKAQTLKAIQAGQREASVTASAVTNQLLFGTDNSFAFRDIGTAETVEALTLADVKAFYDAHYHGGNVRILAVSDLEQEALTTALGVLGDWEAKGARDPMIADFPDLAAGTLYLIDKPGAAQSEIRVAKRFLPYDATGEFFRATLMNYPLGGAFNSRININLREDKGYTYGARARFVGDADFGQYVAGAGVRSDATAASLTEFFAEIDGYHTDGITEEELAFTKSSIGQQDARKYETPYQKLAFLERILAYDLPDDFVEQQLAILDGLTVESVNALAAEHLDRDEMIVVVVGDAASRRAEIEALGLPIVELDPAGRPVE